MHFPKERAEDKSACGGGCGGAGLSDEDREALKLWRSLTPDLRQVARRLPNLPAAVRAGIAALVRAAITEEGSG